MEEAKSHFNDLKDHVTAYIRVRKRIVILKGIKASAVLFGNFLSVASRSFIFLLALVSVSIAAALYLGEISGRYSFGFLALAGFYFFCGILFFSLRKRMEKYFADQFIGSLTEKIYRDETERY